MLLRDLVGSAALTFASLLPIVNPIESVPLFVRMTQDLDVKDRHALALAVTINSGLLLLGSLVLGPLILRFFGLDLAAVRIAGGFVVVAVGWKIFNSTDAGWGGSRPPELKSEQPRKTTSFYPLTMPLTVGPGSISVAVALGSQGAKSMSEIAVGVADYIGYFLGLGGIALTIFVCYRYADRVLASVSDAAIEAVVRISAFILMCVGVQIVWQGYCSLKPL